jgi:hypothetical protein
METILTEFAIRLLQLVLARRDGVLEISKDRVDYSEGDDDYFRIDAEDAAKKCTAPL